MSSTRLGTLLGATVRQQRHLRELNQRQLAEMAGVSQAAVARVESGSRTPSIAILETLLAAMDIQLTVGVEPLDAHLDARIDDLAARPIAERIDELDLGRLLDRLPDLPKVITGSTAALLQGAPVPVDALEIALRWQDSKPFTGWLEANYGQRWNARWGEFGGVWLDPEEPGEHRWSTRYGEIRATMCDELPATIEVRHGGRGYQVVPLVELELTEPRAAELLRRYRARQLAS
ncbi:helix-turn-helix transcriptional regulator [Micromonospora profundi]|uniref:Helix-turn-helix transcriptional regulator n=1 Tax=Micromonospora profundi TaxID=1420889 RepID=A0AAJ6HZZ1_9ACTN|nr:helix-turn-helix transcriptional regulator [Micromonospora profundi]NJC16258.1 transcriptional regulator with XRE-family HTH domain [Micromonospora profundi]WLS47664.1 helix-turn-helix transcriptional regulator [Micromonospora profundi]